MKLLLPTNQGALVGILIGSLAVFWLLSKRILFNLGLYHDPILQIGFVTLLIYLFYPLIVHNIVTKAARSVMNIEGEDRIRLLTKTENRLRNLAVFFMLLYFCTFLTHTIMLIAPPDRHIFIFVMLCILFFFVMVRLVCRPIKEGATLLKEKANLDPSEFDAFDEW